MGIFLKNKPSSINSIISTGIVLYVLMLILGVFFLRPQNSQGEPSSKHYLIEFQEAVASEEVDAVVSILNSKSVVNHNSVEFISKQQAFELMTSEINRTLIDDVKDNNPFRDVIRFQFSELNVTDNQDLLSLLEKEQSIDGLYSNDSVSLNSKEEGKNEGTLISLFIPARVLLFLGLFLILTFVYLAAKIRELILNNSELIKSLSIYGSDGNYITAAIRSSILPSTFKAWILGLLLLILSFYLMLGNLDLRIPHISLGKLIVVILAPLALILIFQYLYLNSKISDYLKSHK